MGRGGEEVREGRGRRKGLKLGIFMRKANKLYKYIHTDICSPRVWQVSSVLRWSEKSGSHFRVKARAILLRVIRKFGYVCECGRCDK